MWLLFLDLVGQMQSTTGGVWVDDTHTHNRGPDLLTSIVPVLKKTHRRCGSSKGEIIYFFCSVLLLCLVFSSAWTVFTAHEMPHGSFYKGLFSLPLHPALLLFIYV